MQMTAPKYLKDLKILIFFVQKIYFALCVWLFKRTSSEADMGLRTYFQWHVGVTVKNFDGEAEDLGLTLKYEIQMVLDLQCGDLCFSALQPCKSDTHSAETALGILYWDLSLG